MSHEPQYRPPTINAVQSVQSLSEEPAHKGGGVQAPARLRMTYEEYLHWADEDVHAE